MHVEKMFNEGGMKESRKWWKYEGKERKGVKLQTGFKSAATAFIADACLQKYAELLVRLFPSLNSSTESNNP